MNQRVFKMIGITVGIISGLIAATGSMTITTGVFADNLWVILIGVGVSLVGGLTATVGRFITAIKSQA